MIQVVKLNEILSRNEEQIEIEESEVYTQVTVRLWGKGVCKRDEVKGSEIKSKKRYLIKENQFIISKIDARHGAYGLVPNELNKAITTADFLTYNLDFKILPQYFEWIFRQKKFIEQCLRASSGTTNRIRLQESKFLDFDIPLPSIEQQKEIIRQLNKYNDIIIKIEDYNLKNGKIVQNLRSSILLEAVFGKLVAQEPTDEPASEFLKKIKIDKDRLIREKKIKKEKPLLPVTKEEIPCELPNGWEWVRLGIIGASEDNAIVDGPFGSNLLLSDYDPSGNYPVISISNIDEGFDLGLLRKINEKKFNELKRSTVRSGDLLIAKIGSSYGKVGIYPKNLPIGIIPTNLLKITCHPDLDKKYLIYYLKSPFQKNQLDKIVSHTAQPAFNMSNFKRLLFPLPPLNEQKRIVEKVDQLMNLCDELEQNVKENQKNSKLLMEIVLKEAFEA